MIEISIQILFEWVQMILSLLLFATTKSNFYKLSEFKNKEIIKHTKKIKKI